MNISKHMEFIFLGGALALIGASAVATASVPALVTPLAPPTLEATLQHEAIPSVVVAAKRLTAEEKAALGE